MGRATEQTTQATEETTQDGTNAEQEEEEL